MQVHEIETMFDGYRLRCDDINLRVAYFVYWIIAPHLRKSSNLSPEKIARPLMHKKEKSKNELLSEKKHYMKFAEKIAKKGGA